MSDLLGRKSTENGGGRCKPPYRQISHDTQVLPSHGTKRKNVQESRTFCRMYKGPLSGRTRGWPWGRGWEMVPLFFRPSSPFSARLCLSLAPVSEFLWTKNERDCVECSLVDHGESGQSRSKTGSAAQGEERTRRGRRLSGRSGVAIFLPRISLLAIRFLISYCTLIDLFFISLFLNFAHRCSLTTQVDLKHLEAHRVRHVSTGDKSPVAVGIVISQEGPIKRSRIARRTRSVRHKTQFNASWRSGI